MKKHKSSCPFASANQADVLATIVIKSKINGRTIPLVLAVCKLKAKARKNLQNQTQNVSARSQLHSRWILSCQNEDCLSRTVHFSDQKFLRTFAFRSCNFFSVRYLHAYVPEGFPCLRKCFFSVFGISQAVSLEGM